MTTSLVAATRVSAPTRGGLRYIPTVAFGTDLVLVTFSVFAAILGREAIPFADLRHHRRRRLADHRRPVMIIGWVAAIFLLGGYRPQVFGAGLDEYKHMVNASMLTAAAVGIGCYLLQFQLSRGFFVLAFADRHPGAGARPVPAASQHPPRPQPRRPPAPRDHRRQRGSRRRDRQRPASRDLARLQRGRRPDPRARRPLGHPLRHPAARLGPLHRRDRHRRRGRRGLPRRWRGRLRQSTCVASPGTSSTRTSPWSSRRASPTSPASASASARSAACR